MDWLYLISYFFGGVFLCNAIPHLTSGLTGHPFQSPFATPFGQGLSSSTVNVLWGALNLVVAYILICRVGDFRLRSTVHVVTLGLGFLLIGPLNAHHFGRFHGGNSPVKQVTSTDRSSLKPRDPVRTFGGFGPLAYSGPFLPKMDETVV